MVEYLNLGSFHVFKGTRRDWVEYLRKFSSGKTELRKAIYDLAGKPFRDVLDNPYVYLWSVNNRIYYIGYTSGGNSNRGLSILSLLIFPTGQHTGRDRCQNLQNEGNLLTDDEEVLAIVFIRTENERMAKILERVLIETVHERPPCNND